MLTSALLALPPEVTCLDPQCPPSPVSPATLLGLDSSHPGCQPRPDQPVTAQEGSMLLKCLLITCCWTGTHSGL